MKTLFVEQTTHRSKVVVLAVVSLSLMLVDQFTDLLDGIRGGMSLLTTPVVFVADAPGRVLGSMGDSLQSRDGMQQRIRELERQILLLKARTEKMAAMTAENRRLRDLLGSASKVEDNVLVAELIGIDPDPERHEILVDKGSNDGVFVGQPVIDAEGLMGQVISVSPVTSRVLLVSDVTHSVPVQVVRSNLRLIAQGSGVNSRLEVVHVQDTADVRQGDVLVTSGLGGRFPVGYPVGVVNRVQHDPGHPFATVNARPTAMLDRTRYVLLVFRENGVNGNAPGATETGSQPLRGGG